MTGDPSSNGESGSVDELTSALFGSVCHDLGGPLSSLTANVTFAQELLAEARPDVPSARAAVELAAILDDMSLAVGNMAAQVADLRALVIARPGDGALPFEVAVTTALRLARLPISRARIEVAVAEVTGAWLAVDRSAFVGALARSMVAIARRSAPGRRLEIVTAPEGAGVSLVVGLPAADCEPLALALDAVGRAIGHAGGSLSVREGANGTVQVTLSGPIALP